MIKKLTEFLNYSLFAELALVMFGLIFVAIVIRTLMLRSDSTKHQANIVLDDNTENPV